MKVEDPSNLRLLKRLSLAKQNMHPLQLGCVIPDMDIAVIYILKCYNSDCTIGNSNFFKLQVSFSLDEEKNGYVARDQLLYAL